ncbi:MAG: SPOR domain-containing protein [Holosporaceae bacterium]|jgi:cell division septation protein DedD|nr:SPOR domain-containing protein [Holosporaceae bacterium]
MCPFLDDEDDCGLQEEASPTLEPERNRLSFLKNDRKFFLVGVGASITAFCVVAYIMYSNTKPLDLEELPVIRADNTPFKEKPTNVDEVKHQDKIVYDNISGDKRKIEEKVVASSEEIISIPEIEKGESLSEEEKKNIIQAFDDLAPEKEYKINYVKKDKAIKTGNLTVVEDAPPINRIREQENKRNTKQQQKSLLPETKNKEKKVPSSGLMVQIASVHSKSSAEMEYNRISLKNKYLSEFGKKIQRVDLGEKKGIKYRVQVGPFESKEEAAKIISNLKNNGCAAYITK